MIALAVAAVAVGVWLFLLTEWIRNGLGLRPPTSWEERNRRELGRRDERPW